MDERNAFNPFSRWFSNEKERELQETHDLYNSLARYKIDRDKILYDIGKTIMPLIRHLPDDVSNACLYLNFDVIRDEPYLEDVQPPQFDKWSLKEFVDYRNRLYAKQYFLRNKKDILGYVESIMVLLFERVVNDLPALGGPSPFNIPLMYSLTNPRILIGNILGSFTDEALTSRGIFKEIGATLYYNTCSANGRTETNGKPYLTPKDSKLPLDEVVDLYLKGTPFIDLFKAPIPLKMNNEVRFSHWHILAGTGAGKTTLLENLIRHDLAQPDPPSLVIIEPHSDLVRKLARSDLGIDPIIIDARYPVAINPFAINQERMASYDELTREQVTASTIQTLSTLLSDIFNVPLTGKQATFFRFMIRFLISFPETMGRNATILDMMKLMTEMAPYKEAISRLPDIQREFFEVDFKTGVYKDTKEQVRYRLQALIENPLFARLFTATETKIDFFTEMNRGSIILIDTAKDHLKEGSAVFGKLMISLLSHAILERAAIPEQERKPAFLMIDEAGSYFTTDIGELLAEARKYKTGLILSHQLADHASPALRASLASNTATKFCGSVSASDATYMARDMRCTADFIMTQPQYSFAAHIRNVTPQAVSIPVGPVRDYPKLSDRAYAELLERNREKIAMPQPAPRRHQFRPEETGEPHSRSQESQPSSQVPDEDISKEW